MVNWLLELVWWSRTFHPVTPISRINVISTSAVYLANSRLLFRVTNCQVGALRFIRITTDLRTSFPKLHQPQALTSNWSRIISVSLANQINSDQLKAPLGKWPIRPHQFSNICWVWRRLAGNMATPHNTLEIPAPDLTFQSSRFLQEPSLGCTLKSLEISPSGVRNLDSMTHDGVKNGSLWNSVHRFLPTTCAGWEQARS